MHFDNNKLFLLVNEKRILNVPITLNRNAFLLNSHNWNIKSKIKDFAATEIKVNVQDKYFIAKTMKSLFGYRSRIIL